MSVRGTELTYQTSQFKNQYAFFSRVFRNLLKKKFRQNVGHYVTIDWSDQTVLINTVAVFLNCVISLVVFRN